MAHPVAPSPTLCRSSRRPAVRQRQRQVSLGARARRLVPVLVVAAAVNAMGCLGGNAIQRSYYVLHGITASRPSNATIAGQVRVRNLDAASIYEKFQIVVRRSPYQLTYAETDVWAVKPNRMVSDVVAETLSSAKQFGSVIRELGELRPDYIISGDLHAIEVYDSGDVWYAHLAMILQLSTFQTGETLLTMKFDERKHVPGRTFSQAARALSELLSTAMDDFMAQLDHLAVTRLEVESPQVLPPTPPDLPGPPEPGTIEDPTPGRTKEPNAKTNPRSDSRSKAKSSALSPTKPPSETDTDASHGANAGETDNVAIDEDGTIFVPVGSDRNLGSD